LGQQHLMAAWLHDISEPRSQDFEALPEIE